MAAHHRQMAPAESSRDKYAYENTIAERFGWPTEVGGFGCPNAIGLPIEEAVHSGGLAYQPVPRR
jgi:hypothetical protein